MFHFKKLASPFALAIFFTTSLWASGMHNDMEHKSAAANVSEKGTQKLCPVRGEPIDPSAHVDVQGQRIYFCCQGCDKKFKQDPESHFEKMKARGEVAESVQTVCPVSGDVLNNHNVSVTLAGRKIYFCCKDCIADFKKDKDKYLKKLEKTAPEKSEAQEKAEKQEAHQGSHSH
jgi:YHS domain-containing protein